ncbi:hypothetical protein R3P38DRAFT_3451498 [Favolaschia claudopus]|uniref:Uncharacterized protein n=1 Tax=Favolaschia claudopus TaxID=2862362 RepID=A0AAV9ZKP4_9AGAR
MPPRRNPPRARTAPRPADVTHSYAVASATTVSDSSDDEELGQSIPLVREPSIELSDPPSPILGDDYNLDLDQGGTDADVFDIGHESNSVPDEHLPSRLLPPRNARMEVDSDGNDDATYANVTSEIQFFNEMHVSALTYREHIELLISKIEHLDPSHRASTAGAVIHDIPENPFVVEGGSHPVPLAVDSGTVPNVIRPPTPMEAVYLVTVQETCESGRTFTQTLPATDAPDATLITRLSAGALGRRLSRLDRSQFYVGTAFRSPADIRQDYMHWSTGWRELGGTWAELEATADSELSNLIPVDSQECAALLSQLGRALHTPVYTVYIFHGDVTSEQNPRIHGSLPPPVLPTVNHPTPTVAPLTAAAPQEAPAPPVMAPPPPPGSAAADNGVRTYLQRRFASRYERIAHASTASYGTGYRICMQEKHIQAICGTLGVTPAASVVADGFQIGFLDVVLAGGLIKKTFNNGRTHVGQARVARRRLALFFSPSNPYVLPPLGTNTRFQRFDQILKLMLKESDIDDGYLEDNSGSAEKEALTISLEAFKAEVKAVLDAFTF